jgi:hypothetical protein
VIQGKLYIICIGFWLGPQKLKEKYGKLFEKPENEILLYSTTDQVMQAAF